MARTATRHRRIAALAIAALAVSPLLAAAAKSTSDPARDLAGRYYRQFPNGTVDGDKYTGEDVVEIVPVAPGSAYVRIHLDYYNGHSCGIFGVGRSQGGALVYRDPGTDSDGSHCVLSVRRAGASLKIDDSEGSCSRYCGMRGTLHDVSMPYASKRPIRYMARLKASDAYRRATAEWRTGQPQP
jgi:hypothetical protein